MGDSDRLVNAEVAWPLTNTMLWRGSLEQAVQTIRLVAPGSTPVSRKRLVAIDLYIGDFRVADGQPGNGTGGSHGLLQAFTNFQRRGQLAQAGAIDRAPPGAARWAALRVRRAQNAR